jgi:superfamily II DNA or RNA helicase
MIYLTKIDEVFLEVQCSEDQAVSLHKYLKCFSPGYKFSPAYKNRQWDGKISFFQPSNCKLPIGLFYAFVEWATKNNYQYELKWKQPVYQINDEFMDKFYEMIFENSPLYPRDYQDHAIKIMLRLRRGVIEYATGSGKSLIIYALIRYLLAFEDRRIVIIVPTIQLVEQLRLEFIDPINGYGWSKCDDFVTRMHTKVTPDITKPVLISTYQSLANKDDSFVMRYNTVIIDEVHTAKAKTIKDFAIKSRFADVRLGVTGTLPSIEEVKRVEDRKEESKFKKKDSEIIQTFLYTIFAYVGPKIAEIHSKELMDRGVLSKIAIANIILKYPDEVVKRLKSADYNTEIREINQYPNRNRVFDLIFKKTPSSENTIILCYLREHLASVHDYVKAMWGDKFKIDLIHGDVNVEDRLKICAAAELEGGHIIVATYGTLSVGINIKRIHNVIFGSSYKAKIKVLQSIGRGLRLHETKLKLILYDIVDDLRWIKRGYTIGQPNCYGFNYVYEQFEYRLEYYKSQGYEINNYILPI